MAALYRALLLLLCTLLARPLAAANADIELVGGVYQNIVLGVKDGTDEPASGTDFLDQLREFLNSGSNALHYAMDGTASFGDVTLVLPRSWDKTKFGHVEPALVDLTAASADILLHDTPDTIPDTLQGELCGVPGRQIRLPISFLSLTTEQEQVYGTPGRILTHEWAHYRWGAHDEHGFGGDPVYQGGYGDFSMSPTSCAAGNMWGVFYTDCSGDSRCSANDLNCHFCFNELATPEIVQASLGYLPAMSTGKFCTSDTHNRASPTQQNLLCGQRSVTELIEAHPDALNMTAHTVTPINIVVREEPLGRVLFLLNIPSFNEEELNYEDLLNNVQLPLMKYPTLEVAVMTFKAGEAGGVELVTTRQFAPIPADGFNSLKESLPEVDNLTLVPDLNMVLYEMYTTIGDYEAGTLIVMPITNSLLVDSKLDLDLGRLLREKRMKPLLLFPEAEPNLEVAGSFLQTSGARFIHRNDSSGPLNYASVTAEEELRNFVDNTFRNDHPVVLIDSSTLSPDEAFESTLVYQTRFTQHRLAVVTSSNDVSQLTVKKLIFGSYRDCGANCIVTDDAIFFMETETNPSVTDGKETSLQISNGGSESAFITVTWSEVNFANNEDEELSVQVWSSEGRGPVATIPENARLVLYASVMTGEKQVLGSRINVVMDVAIRDPPPALASTHHVVKLLDDGEVTTSGDIRRDDSVFSYAFPGDMVFQKDSVISITSLSITSHSFPGELRASAAATAAAEGSASAAARHNSPQSSGLYTTDPAADVACCGSFVLNPSINLNHRINGFYLYLRSFADIEIQRLIDGSVTAAPNPTTAAPTTAPAAHTTAPAAPTTATGAPISTSPASTVVTGAPTDVTLGPTSGPTESTVDPSNGSSGPTDGPPVTSEETQTTLAGNTLAAPVLLLLFCATAAQLAVAAVRA